MLDNNLILMSDSYKYSHSEQYPENMTYMHHYIESRGGRYGFTQFFGLQYYIKKYLTNRITKEAIDEAEEIITKHGLKFNRKNWEYILEKHNGYIPLRIRAVKEGMVVKNHNVLVTVESTDENCAWLPSFFETLLLKIWYPITVATLSFNYKLMCKKFLEETSDNLEHLDFMLHDFGYRGVSSEESASIGGASHLINFSGTDNIAGIILTKKYYNSDMPGFSVPASEHSTITSWSKENEALAYENILDKYEDSVVSIVVDSYNYYKAIEDIISNKLYEKIKNRKKTLVLRPDSGDAIANILFAMEVLSSKFGYTVNSKGYKVLNNIKILQGDGINENSMWDILKSLKENGYSAENIILGCGGSLLQGNNESSINRDTHKFAMKCSCIIKDNKLVEVFKAPITDRGKVSKKGRLDLIKHATGYKTVQIDHLPLNTYHKNTVMEIVYENGKLLRDINFEEIFKLSNEEINKK